MITEHIAAEGSSPPQPEPAQPDMQHVRARLTDIEEHARALIRKRPVVAVLAAIGGGYLVARLVSRVSR